MAANMQRDYLEEVLEDVRAGCMPNMATLERAAAQMEALKARIAELETNAK